jgi:hypothetical protein
MKEAVLTVGVVDEEIESGLLLSHSILLEEVH